MRDIQDLVSFEGRLAASDAERRAADHLARRLTGLGREVEVEPTFVRRNYPLAHLLHAALGAVGSVVSVYLPAIGLGLVALAVASTLGDLTGRLYLARRLTGRRASQNLTSREGAGEKPGTLVLVAHYDAARTGGVFNRRAQRRRARIGRLIHRPIGLFEIMFWSLTAVLVCAALRTAGLEALALSAVQFVPTVVLIAAVPLLADIGLSGVVPGAVDNASGVAVALRLAETYGEDLEHFDLWVVFPGSEEALQLGMHQWVRRHRRELDPARTIFLDIDKVGNGTVRYVVKAGNLWAPRAHPQVVATCAAIAADDGGERYGARALVARTATAAYAARRRGFPVVTVSCLDEHDTAPDHHQPTDTPDRVEPEALERGLDFCAELIERIDEDIGPRLGRPPSEPVAAGDVEA